MNKIRILHVLGGLDIGGAETLVMNWYRHLDKGKFQFDFIKHTSKSQFFDEEIKQLGGRIYNCPQYKGYNHFTYVKWWKTFFKEHPEYKIIHGHVRSTAAIYLKIANHFKLTTIVHSHNTRNPKGVSALVKSILQFPIRYIADYFFACSKPAGEWLFGKGITKQFNFFVISNAIDTTKFVYNPSRQTEMRHQLGLGNNLVLGNVGRFTTQKNQIFLLKIFSEIYKQNSATRLLLVGDGPLKANLVKQAQELGIRQAVIFSNGQVPSSDYYQAMDIFVFPSLYEGFGIVLIEAQTSGLPCVISANLPKEADLQCGLVTQVDLKQNPGTWAGIVLAQSGKKRCSQQVAAKVKGYDISTTTKWLENFYLEKYDK